MKKGTKIFVSVLCVTAVAAVSAAVFAFTALNKGPFSGTVTESETGNPIADVSVTDGRNVVKTDENGKL